MILFYLLISVMPLIRHPLWGEFVGDLTVVKYLGAGVTMYALIYLFVRRHPPEFFGTWAARCFLVFSILTMGSYAVFGVPDLPFEASPFMNAVSFLIFFFDTLIVVDSMHRLRLSLLTAVGSLGLASLYVLREWQNAGMTFGYRPGWVTGDPNYFSVSAILCLPMALYFLRERTRTTEWWFCLACAVLTLFALITAASRGALLGLTASMLLVVVLARRRLLVLAGAGLFCLLLLVIPGSPLARALNPAGGDEDSVSIHNALVTAGLRMFLDHPLFGVGVGNFKPFLRDFASPEDTPWFEERTWLPHNTYVGIMAELGLPGIVAFLGAFVCTLVILERVRRSARTTGVVFMQNMAESMQIGFIGFGVAIYFLSAGYQKLYWLLVFLALCMPRLLRDAERRQAKKLAAIHGPASMPSPRPR